MKLRDKYKLMMANFKNEELLKEFEEKINHVIVEYGKWGKYGLKYFNAGEWFLHHEEIKKVKSAHIIVLFKDGSYEEI